MQFGNLLLADLSTPFKEPVIIFSFVLLIILLSPLILNRLRIPAIVGMILAGLVIGPNALHLLERDGAIQLFGTVGLLYIMFLAGLEIDMVDYKKNIRLSSVFGLLTFAIPFGIGFLVCEYILHLDLVPSLITSSMFSTQTLVSYPIVSRFGITRTKPVTITVGGTIITDTLVLLLFSIIINYSTDTNDNTFWLRLLISVAIFCFVVLYLIPLFAKWFFRKVEGDGGSQFIFVLSIVFLSAFLSQLAGLEHIIGAFLAGIALNRLIPHQSVLKNRIEFVGNNIFIPFFLINVGMLINLDALFNGMSAIYIAVILVITALITKYLAAWITQKIYRLTHNERNLIFGLSTSHAAATLAIILVAYDLKLLDENILNGTVIVILISCLVSSFITEAAGRKYIVQESHKIDVPPDSIERILVPVSNPEKAAQLLDLSSFIQHPGSLEPIYSLAVIEDDAQTKEKLLAAKKMMEDAVKKITASNASMHILTRVDVNVTSGITRAVKELAITEIVIGWHEKISSAEKLFGSLFDNIIHSTEQVIWVCKIMHPLNTFNRIAILLPPNAEFEPGFYRLLSGITRLSQQIGASLAFWGELKTLEIIDAMNKKESGLKLNAAYSEFTDWEELETVSQNVKSDDLLIVMSARQNSVSHFNQLDHVPQILSKYFQETSFIILFPEQIDTHGSDMNFQYSVLAPSAIKQNIERINKIGDKVTKVFKK